MRQQMALLEEKEMTKARRIAIKVAYALMTLGALVAAAGAPETWPL